MSRPPSTRRSPRYGREIKLRLSLDEHAALLAAAELRGVAPSALARDAALAAVAQTLSRNDG